MAEGTQQYVPVQSSAAAPSVGVVPGIAPDSTFNTVQQYAMKQQIGNLQTARTEAYLDGQLEAAQGTGVQEIRDAQPWVASLFGGGASVHGAVDYMENSRMLEYKESITANMEEHRKLRPEVFKEQQLEQIKQFYTGDDETDSHILRAFGAVLPNVLKLQTKENTKYVQESHLDSMTAFANLAIRNYTSAQAGDRYDKAEAAGFLQNALNIPEGMDANAYKKFLYDMLPVASEAGAHGVIQKIRAQGLIGTPQDMQAIDKAMDGLDKFDAEASRFEYGQALAVLDAQAMNTDVDDETFATQVKAVSKQYPTMSGEQVRSLLNKRVKAKQKQYDGTVLQNNVEAFLGGSPQSIPPKERQDVYGVVLSKAREDSIVFDQMIQGLTSTSDTSKPLKESWTAGLSTPMMTDADGIQHITGTAQRTLQEMTAAQHITEAAGNTRAFWRHLDPNSAALYAAYKTAQSTNVGGSIDEHIQSAMDAVQSGSGTPGASGAVPQTVSEQTRAGVVAWLDDKGVFDTEAFDSPVMSTALNGILNTIDTTLNPEVLAARVQEGLLNTYEKSNDGNWVPMVQGKSVGERTGIDEPWDTIEDYIEDINIPGNEAYLGHDVTVGLDAHRDAFRVFAESGALLGVIPFNSLATWNKQTNTDPAITATKEAAYRRDVRKSRRRLLNNIRNTQSDIEGGYGDNQRLPLETPGDYAERVVGAMSDEEVLQKHRDLVSEYGMDDSVGAYFGDWISETESYIIDKKDAAIGSVMKAYMDIENKTRELLTGYAGDYAAAIKPQYTTIGAVIRDSGEPTRQGGRTVYHGNDAIKKVQAAEGELTPQQKLLIKYEGYSTDAYDDIKGIQTSGVGQTGAYEDKTFKETYADFAKSTSKAVKNFDAYPERLQGELIAAAYRGDLSSKNKWVKLLNAGEYAKAAEELYDHTELQGYLTARAEGNLDAGGNIPERFQNLRNAILTLAR